MESFSDCEFHYEERKAEWLRRERGLSFDVIADYMRNGSVADVVGNPSPRYPHKKIALMEIEDYIVAVPYVRKDNKVFLKTAFKSRKANRQYGGKKDGRPQGKNPRLH